MTRCPLCHTLLAPDDERTICPACSAEVHRSCWDELGGCGTYGCPHAPPPGKPPPPRLLGGWGDSKECPSCGQPIAAGLLTCRCGARFPWAEPMTRDEYRAFAATERRLRTARAILLVLFLGSLLGVPAPACGAAAAVYGRRKRALLAGADGTWLALAYGSAALGIAYALIMALCVLGR